jgi:WD40 repeat protein
MKMDFSKSVLLTFVGLGLPYSTLAADDAVPVDYHGDVAPLLRQYCAGCHNDEDFEGDFSVEYFADVEEGGSKGVMLRSGDPDGSYLIQLLTGGTEEPMPPADEPQPSAAEIELLKRWINEGAKGPMAAEDFSLLSKLTVPNWAPASGEKPVTAMATTADGKVRAQARFGKVSLSMSADVSGIGVLQLEELSGKISALHFAPGDSTKLVTASGVAGLNGVATLWDLRDGSVVRKFGEGYHRDLLYDAEFSPDGKILATAGYDTKIALWDVASGEQVRTIEVHNGAIFDLAFSPDGTVLASASADETVKLWRVADGVRVDTLNQPQGEQYAVAFSPDGRFVVAGGADNVIRMWRFVSKDKPRINPLIHARFAHEDAVVALAVSGDGKWLASSSDDRSVKVWTLPKLEQKRAWNDQPDVAGVLQMTGRPHEFIAARMDGSGQFLRFDAKLIASAPAKGKGVGKAPAKAVAGAGGELKTVMAGENSEVQKVALPAKISGVIGEEGDSDEFRFSAKAGLQWVLEVSAASAKVAKGEKPSPLDSKIEVLDASGAPVEQVRLQAVRDSWFTFRGKDSKQVTDFRVHNWREMELNEYLYCNGEVVKLWLDPRGPDSGFKVYPGLGTRKNYFSTSGLAHALGEPCYVVQPIPAGEEPAPNGLPIYTLYYENDDDPERQLGSDSKLYFTAPQDGEYGARIRDVRGFGGEKYTYDLKIRAPKPDYRMSYDGSKGLAVTAGSGRQFVLNTTRLDDFDGPIRIDVEGLPPGFHATTPIVIEKEQVQAVGAVYANGNAPAPAEENAAQSKLIATAMIDGSEVRREIGSLGKLSLVAGKPKLFVEVLPDGDSGKPVVKDGRTVELTIHPGETITAIVKATRMDFKDRITFGREDSGRNLAHGLIIDNIGLSGLMIHEGGTEQQFFISAKDWVPESERWFFLRCGEAGGHTTQAIRLKVVKPQDGSKVAASGEE